MRRLLIWWWRYGLLLVLYLSFIMFLMPSATVNLNDMRTAIAYQVTPVMFDYVSWEIGAIAAKAEQTLFGYHPFITEADRSAFVRAYMHDLSQAQALDGQISTLYVDPDVSDPEAASAELRAERDALRDSLRARQSTAEAILEGQVAAVLVDEGFGVGGQLLPPMAMRFTRVPNLLITSPRDEIKLEVALTVQPMTTDQQAELEAEVDTRHDVSSLVVPLGGVALYPAMILETNSISFAAETFAHEWLHHYLYFFPLGISYFTDSGGLSGEVRTINETVADLFGKELSRLVLERYYPDLVPPPPPPPSDAPPQPQENEPPAFDFGAEMHETRVTLDEMLAAGQVDEAEAYLEQRREFFFENGYRFRKLNQAFFAFYGGYQGGTMPGAGGEDPIGPAVREIRDSSDSLLQFVERVRGVASLEALLNVRDMYR